MAYDLHGPWEASYLGANTRPQAPIGDINNALLPIWFDGVDPEKINFGIPYYGRGYTLSNTSCADIGCPYSGPSLGGICTGSPGILALYEIEAIINTRSLEPELLPDAMQKQIHFNDQWIGYDDAETIALKTQWADEHCLGGTVVWSVDFINENGKSVLFCTCK
jgi:chitinase